VTYIKKQSSNRLLLKSLWRIDAPYKHDAHRLRRETKRKKKKLGEKQQRS